MRINIPAWRKEPEAVFISVNIIGKDDWSGKTFAEFGAGGQTYVLTIDRELIDLAGENIPALIVADVGDDRYLVDLPGESLSAGSRILLGAGEIKRMNGR